jgi:hypothetical protein
MFEQGEVESCPDCDIPLVPVHRLPPSQESVEAEAVAWEQNAPEDAVQPWHDLKHGRGAFIALGLCSLASFWLAPWLSISSPYEELRTGHALAAGRLGWLWGGAVAWFVGIALIASRRTIHQLQGVRVIATLFAAMTAAEIGILMLRSPTASRLVQFDYEWGWGLYLSLCLSLAGIVTGMRLGRFTPPRAASTEARTSGPTPSTTVH